MVKEALKAQRPVTAGTETGDLQNGLRKDYEYAVLEVVNVQNKKGELEKLYKLRDPEGHSDFKSRWSPLSLEWTPHL